MRKIINTKLLICPLCKSEVNEEKAHKLSCLNCHSEYYYENNRLIFKKLSENDVSDDLDKFKTLFKKWNKLYDLLIKVFSPVFIQMRLKKFIKENIHDNVIAINLGSGNSNISDKIINMDILPYKNVDICCDIENIPFAEASVDVVINIAVLEHTTNAENVVNEIYRILKKGGIVYTYFPFIQPFHASPNDYSRRTIEGLKLLHKKFDVKELRVGAGPTSGFLWVFQEWLAILLSFGIKRIHHYVYLMIMIITFPLKYLDLILSKYSTSKNIASAFVLVAQKNDPV